MFVAFFCCITWFSPVLRWFFPFLLIILANQRMSILVQPKGPHGPIHVPWCHAEPCWAVSPGHLWAVVDAVGYVSSSGSSFLIFILCLPYATSLGFIHYSWHPPISPHSSQGPSFFPRMPKDKYEQRFFSPTLGCFYSVPLLHFYVPLLCPAVQSSSAAPRSASPFKPINQSLDVICLLQHVQDLSVLSAWIGQKALIYTGLCVLLVFFCWVGFFFFCLLCVLNVRVGEMTGLGLLEIWGVSLI